jgi:3-isopropylmalate dehydrogenase
LAGKNEANPLATILSAGMLFDWLGRRRDDARAVQAGAAIEAAVADVLAEAATLPRDLGGSACTDEVGDAVARRLASA